MMSRKFDPKKPAQPLKLVLTGLVYLQADDLPEGITPFDAASDVAIDDQRSAAMYRIRDALNKARPGEAIALLRASRYVPSTLYLHRLDTVGV